MPIRNVGGQSVYVIDAPQIDAARTSTGLGYAQLVSQLRWKIWEEAEKQVARQLELEKMGYQAQLDAYVKQKQELTRALTKTKDLKEKVLKGDVTLSQAISLANADAVTDRANQALKVKFGTEKVYEKPIIDPLSGQPTGKTVPSYSYVEPKEGQEFKPVARPSSRVGQIAEQLGVDTPEDRKAAAEAAADAKVKSLESEWMNRFKTANPQDLSAEAWSQSPEGAEVEKALAAARQELDTIKGTPASQFKAQQDAAAESDLDDFAAQLQAEIDALEAPSLGFDTNVLSRTRETFGGMAGVGGFGFAPRPSKISPIYDEGRAREALSRQDVLAEEFITATEAAERKDLEARDLKEKERRRASRLAELETVIGPLASPEEVAKAAEEVGILNLMDTSTLTPDERMRLNRVARERAEAAYRESALLAGPGERTAGTFMDIPREEVSLDGFTRTERGPRQPREPREPRERFPREPRERFPREPRERFPREPRERPLSYDGGEVERFPSPSPSLFGPAGTTSRPPNIYDLEFMGVPPVTPVPPQPPPPPPPLPPPPTPPLPPPLPPPPGGSPPPGGPKREDLGGGVVYDRISGVIFGKDGFPIFVITKPANPNTAAPYQPEVITREEMNKKAEEIRAAGGYEVKGLGVEKSGAVKPKTRQEKYAASSFSIVKAGSALADRPAKLARLAKLDLPEKERSRQVPEHILLVDKIYGINKGKANAYKATFDEIARVYKSDEKKKKEAQEYLTATHLLYSEGLA